MVLDRFGLRGRLGDLRREGQRETGAPCVTFSALRRVFPTFPVLLEARYRGGVAQHLSPAVLLRRFEATFLVHDYLGTFARLAGEALGRPVGLVVPFGGYRGGVVVHNGELDTRGTRVVHDLAGDVPPHRLTAEPFHGLLRYLAADSWDPESGAAAWLPRQGPRVVGPGLPAGLVRRVGPGPALVVLAWLLGALETKGGYARRFVRRRDGG